MAANTSNKSSETPDPEAFIARWKKASGPEIANYGLFIQELCQLLGVPQPDPASDDNRDNAYVFQRRVTFRHGDGSESYGFIDCYRRDAFVLEAKKIRKPDGKAFDDAMLRARSQAEQYARSLPAAEGRPPFLVVSDVGNAIELYSEFTRSGATYTPFPDPRSHRIRLDDLRDEAQRERLRQVWLDPLSLDPSRRSAKVTRDIATQLAKVAKTLEGAGHAPESVAGFLTRCLFSMFAEDIGLLPARAFTSLIESLMDSPQQFVPLLGDLWKAMDAGEFSVSIRTEVLRFNGKLFKEPLVIPLDRDQIGLLLEAAKFDWREVEPAIFGTLLERALNPEDRHKLGAHYTPRAYVERLVLPTVVEPLREDWKLAQAAALLLAADGKMAEARKQIHEFHHQLCEVRVLDPACGSGNFLYVTLEHLKRFEGEVLNQLEELGEAQERFEAVGVDPHQLLGIEINPRAAAIAELVLWIGYLQWHFRTRGNVMPPQPVLRDFHNIECRDAVLAYDRMEYVTDERGVPVSRWDGKTMKKHPVTGEDVPDETARVPLERYVNPRKARWPTANFVVGNPPFIGNKRMRDALGDGYVEALRGVSDDVPDTADFVMYWWDHAAQMVRNGDLRRFGLITTNSLRQTFNRKIVERHLGGRPPLLLAFAIPDHPWVDSANGADVRIAMSVGTTSVETGTLVAVVEETPQDDGEVAVQLEIRRGEVHADLSVGAKVGAAQHLTANESLCFQGMNLVGKGFRLTLDQVRVLGYDTTALQDVIKPHRNARDMMQGGEDCYVIDFFGYSAEQARAQHPALYQWLFDRVKPERDHNNRESRRRNWWLFGEPVGRLRKAWTGLSYVILTPETSKHRVFEYQALPFCPDHKLYAVCSSDALLLGVLSSEIHRQWSLRAGGRLGVGNDPTWTNTTCFLTFPFPSASAAQADRVRTLATQLDAHRKRQQAQHTDLTLTAMYNALEKLKSGEALSAKEKVVHEQGLVSVLKQLHDELDLAVLDAYGWSDLAPLMQVVNGNAAPGTNATPATREDCKRALDDALLERLVALNAERAAEEKRGLIRWLRPEFQNPQQAKAPEQQQIDMSDEAEEAQAVVAKTGKTPWPKSLPDQVRLVAEVVAAARSPLGDDDIAALFAGKGPWKRRLPQIVETLVSLGRARRVGGKVIAAD